MFRFKTVWNYLAKIQVFPICYTPYLLLITVITMYVAPLKIDYTRQFFESCYHINRMLSSCVSASPYHTMVYRTRLPSECVLCARSVILRKRITKKKKKTPSVVEAIQIKLVPRKSGTYCYVALTLPYWTKKTHHLWHRRFRRNSSLKLYVILRIILLSTIATLVLINAVDTFPLGATTRTRLRLASAAQSFRYSYVKRPAKWYAKPLERGCR